MWAIQPGASIAKRDLPAATFNPAALSNAVFGVDAYSLNTSPVATWPNLTSHGSARDAVQVTGSKKPTWGATAFNSVYPGVTFDGIDDYLRTSGFTLSQPYHIIMVCALAATSINKVLIDGVAAQSAIYQGGAGGNAQLFAGLNGPTKIIGTTPHVISAKFNNASSSIALDNGSATTGTIGVNNPGGVTLGNDLNTPGTGAANLIIAACWVFSSILASVDEIAVVRYGGTRFGITVA